MLPQICSCDIHGFCPYNSSANTSCEFWCGVPEPQDDPEEWEDDLPDEEWYDDDWDEELEEGFDPYMGCYTEDC